MPFDRTAARNTAPRPARRRRRRCRASAAVARIVACGAVRSGADDHARTGRRCTRGSPRRSTVRFSSASSALASPVVPRATMPLTPGGRVLVAQAFDRADVDRALRVERRDQRNPDAAEIEVARHAAIVLRCRTARSRGRSRCRAGTFLGVPLWLEIRDHGARRRRHRRAVGHVRHRRRGRLDARRSAPSAPPRSRPSARRCRRSCRRRSRDRCATAGRT